MSGGGRPGLTTMVVPLHVSNHFVIIENKGNEPLDQYLKRGSHYSVQFPEVIFIGKVLASFPEYVAFEHLGIEPLIGKITEHDVVTVHFRPLADGDALGADSQSQGG